MSLFQKAQTILAYCAVQQEPDLSPLWSLSKHWGLPRCVGRDLAWHRWQVGDRLETGTYGIMEPFAEAESLSPSSVDLVLVPAVACDRQGYRLGYGGGYYDRLFSLPDWQSIPTVGIVFDFAYVPQLPKDHWDRPLTGLCSDQQRVMFASLIRQS
jgi:5-formyltetrahydrofolate cyclo-ligase